LHGDEDAIRMLEKLNRERDLRQGIGGKREKMQATNERVLLPGKKRASVVYLQGKTKYVHSAYNVLKAEFISRDAIIRRIKRRD